MKCQICKKTGCKDERVPLLAFFLALFNSPFHHKWNAFGTNYAVKFGNFFFFTALPIFKQITIIDSY